MGLVKVIEEIIADSFRALDKNRVFEENSDGKGRPFLMERRIDNRSNLEYCLYQFDKDPGTNFPWFKSDMGLRTMCDYILFVEDENSDGWCLLIELKKGKEDARPQLHAGKLFAEFLIQSAVRIGGSIGSDVSYRKIRIGENEHLRHGQRIKKLDYDVDGYLNLVTDSLNLRYLLR